MKRILSLLVLSSSFLASLAQLDNTVEVTNEVKPVVTDAKKVDVKTKQAETKVTHYTMQYAVEGQPLNNYAPEPLGNYESEAVWKGNKKGYVHLGGGSHGNLDGLFTYQFDLTDQDALGIDFSLKGFNGKTRDNTYFGTKDWKSRDYQNRSGLHYMHQFDNGSAFFAKGAFENRLFNYMGGYGVTDKQHDVMGNALVGLTSYQVGDLRLNAMAGVDFFGQNHKTSLAKKLRETTFHVDADAAYQLTEEHGLGLGLGFAMGSPTNYMILENTNERDSTSAIATVALVRQVGTTIAPAIFVGFISADNGVSGYQHMLICIAVFCVLAGVVTLFYKSPKN